MYVMIAAEWMLCLVFSKKVLCRSAAKEHFLNIVLGLMNFLLGFNVSLRPSETAQRNTYSWMDFQVLLVSYFKDVVQVNTLLVMMEFIRHFVRLSSRST